MFKKQIYQIFITLSFCASVPSAQSAYDPTDARNILVKNIRDRYGPEISARQAQLGTNYNGVALLDIAREKLEHGVFLPTDPDWALVIRYVLLGYGHEKTGVDSTPVTHSMAPVRTAEVMTTAHLLSSACLIARNLEPTIKLEEISNHSAAKAFPELHKGHIDTLNGLVTNIPEEVRVYAAKVVDRLHQLSELSTYNAWFAHERFWATAGVLGPDTDASLREIFGKSAHADTPLNFLNELNQQLDEAITALNANPEAPAPEAIVDLVKRSRQILLTIAAGTPTGEDSYARLDPTTIADWQIIRKALFLALSVTSLSKNDDFTSFLSTVFDCGRFYPEKTEADPVKTYYWKIQALCKGLRVAWRAFNAGKSDGVISQELRQIIDQSDPLFDYNGPRKVDTKMAMNEI